jgi:hypothetical protein
MIQVPDRLSGLITLIEGGSPVEEVHARLRQVAILQPLDLVRMQQQYMENATKLEEETDGRLNQLLAEFINTVNPVITS